MPLGIVSDWVSVLNCTGINNVRIILTKDCKIMVNVFCHVQFMQAVIEESPSNYIQYCNLFYPTIHIRHGHQKQNRGMGVGSNLTINFFLAANRFKNKQKGNKSKVNGKMLGRHIVVDHSKGVGVFRIIEWLGRSVYSMTLTYNFLFCFVTLFILHYLDFLLISKSHLCFDT